MLLPRVTWHTNKAFALESSRKNPDGSPLRVITFFTSEKCRVLNLTEYLKIERWNGTQSGKNNVELQFHLQTEKESTYQRNTYSKLSTKILNK